MRRFRLGSLASQPVVVLLMSMLGSSAPVHARSGRKVRAPATAATTTVAVVSDGPDIFLESKREVEKVDSGMPLDADKWDAACAPPCDRPLPRAALFRVNGEGVNPSSAFALPPDRDQVTLNVKVGRARWYWTGVLLSALGGSFVLGGAGPPLLLGGSFSTPEKILGGAGVVMLAAGLPLWILNRTTVSIR